MFLLWGNLWYRLFLNIIKHNWSLRYLWCGLRKLWLLSFYWFCRFRRILYSIAEIIWNLALFVWKLAELHFRLFGLFLCLCFFLYIFIYLLWLYIWYCRFWLWLITFQCCALYINFLLWCLANSWIFGFDLLQTFSLLIFDLFKPFLN